MNPHTYIGLPTIVQQMHQLNVRMNVLQLDIIIKRKSLDDIFKEVCIATKVVPFEIRSSSREYDVKNARHIFFYIAHKHTKIQLEVIGRYLNRHHATVLHGYHKISNQLIYKDISNLVDEIESKLKTNK
jgi:chromosomal replication initiation ATPase DnaA